MMGKRITRLVLVLIALMFVKSMSGQQAFYYDFVKQYNSNGQLCAQDLACAPRYLEFSGSNCSEYSINHDGSKKLEGIYQYSGEQNGCWVYKRTKATGNYTMYFTLMIKTDYSLVNRLWNDNVSNWSKPWTEIYKKTDRQQSPKDPYLLY